MSLSLRWNTLSLRNYYPFNDTETTTLAGMFEGGEVILIWVSVKLVTLVIFWVNAPYLTVTLQAASYWKPDPIKAERVPPCIWPLLGVILSMTGSL